MKKVKFNPSLREELGEIIGIFASDGSFIKDRKYTYKIRIHLSSDEYEYSLRIKKLFENVFGKPGRIYTNKAKNMFIFEVFGKRIIEIFHDYIDWDHGKKTYTIRLSYPLKKYDKYFLQGFIRGLFNGDGWISIKNAGFGSVSGNLIKNVKQILNTYNIRYGHRSYIPKNKHMYHMLNIPSSEREKLVRTFKLKNMLPMGVPS